MSRLTLASVNGRRRIHANLATGYPSGSGVPQSMSMSAIGGGVQAPTSILLGILPNDPRSLHMLYEDMYKYDSVAGTAADMKSTMITSEFTLTDCKDPKNIKRYLDECNRLGFPTVLPQMMLDRYISGAYLSTLLFNDSQKMFTGQIPYRVRDAEIIPCPIYGMSPIIKMTISEDTKKFMNNDSDYAKQIKNELSPEMVSFLTSGKSVELDPLATLWLPRLNATGSEKGVSLFERVLPLFALEKMLYRGTFSEAMKRQRAVLHVTAGNEDWIPQNDELSEILGLFQTADLDPVGAIVATRADVATNEVRAGGDFWKYTDIIDVTTTIKLRAMGISETFLSGESSYNAMETALSVFIENARSERDEFTNQCFTRGIFPKIAHINGMYKANTSDIKQKDVDVNNNAGYQLNLTNIEKYDIPKVNWKKSLRPEADSAYLEILDHLEEKGLPVTMAMWAAAGGVELSKLTEGQEEDMKTRKAIEAIKAKFSSEGASEGETEEMARLLTASVGGNKPTSILDRDFSFMSEVVGRTVTGKRKYIVNQKAALRREYNKIRKAIDTLATDDASFSNSQARARSVIKSGKLVANDGSTHSKV